MATKELVHTGRLLNASGVLALLAIPALAVFLAWIYRQRPPEEGK